MGDLYLHLAFARRLRFAEGLHPLVREAMVRRSPYVALGATLAQLPTLEVKSGGFFRRLLKLGQSDADRWKERLAPTGSQGPDFVVALLTKGSADLPGPLTRVALTMGALSHQLLGGAVDETVKDLSGVEREAIERGQARLWTQNAVTVQRHLQDEWAPALAFFNLEAARPTLGHLSAAMKSAFSDAPTREMLGRWGRALAQNTLPLVEKCALPDPGPIPDHTVREQYFEGDARFLERTEDVTAQLVFLSGQLGELFLEKEPTSDKVRTALLDDDGFKKAPPPASLDQTIADWHNNLVEVRKRALSRGRNPQAAYNDDGTEVELSIPPLPPDGPAPTVTQEVSLAQIEAEIGAKTPTMTQEVSLAQIEDELGTAGADGEAMPPPAPANTQQISAADIEAEVASAQKQDGFQAPAHTQQISADDIEAEVAAQTGGGLQAPAHTQQISADDIEAEVAAQTLQAPAHTQQISADDIEAEVAAQAAASGARAGGTAGPPGPPPVSGEGAPVPPQSDEGPAMPPPDEAAASNEAKSGEEKSGEGASAKPASGEGSPDGDPPEGDKSPATDTGASAAADADPPAEASDEAPAPSDDGEDPEATKPLAAAGGETDNGAAGDKADDESSDEPEAKADAPTADPASAQEDSAENKPAG